MSICSSRSPYVIFCHVHTKDYYFPMGAGIVKTSDQSFSFFVWTSAVITPYRAMFSSGSWSTSFVVTESFSVIIASLPRTYDRNSISSISSVNYKSSLIFHSLPSRLTRVARVVLYLWRAFVACVSLLSSLFSSSLSCVFPPWHPNEAFSLNSLLPLRRTHEQNTCTCRSCRTPYQLRLRLQRHPPCVQVPPSVCSQQTDSPSTPHYPSSIPAGDESSQQTPSLPLSL